MMRDTTPDIVTRLRECAAQCDHPTSLLYDLAADEIERLHAAIGSVQRSAFDAGFLGRQMPDLSRIYDLTLLNQVLTEEGKKAIQ